VPSDIVQALSELGYDEIKVVDEEAQVLCPYHDDTSLGSFSVNVLSGVNHCFSCGESGQFVRIVQKANDWSFEKSALWCQTRAAKGMRLFDEEPVTYSGKVDTTQQINEASLALFTDPPEVELSKRSITLEAAKEYGVLWDKDTWILPIRDPETGELWGWQRKGTDGVRNRPRGVDKSRTLFGIQSVSSDQPGTCILVESPLDCVRFLTAGIEGAVSSYGVHVSSEQLSLLGSRAERVVLALDNDDSGSRISCQLCLGHYDSTRQWQPAFSLAPLFVYNYGASTAKDPGEQSDEEIRWGLENATPAFRTRFF
jgi:DNA primase